ncbi:MAG: hypothetical protein OEV30_03075 [Ignavibacteria bacterium]|nr:hypothetical protein [Ignavibacteria bacterium]
MNRSFEHLSRFFESIGSLSFWQRLFGWKRILSLSYPAYEEFKILAAMISRNSIDLEESRRRVEELTAEAVHKAAAHGALVSELRGTAARQTAEIGRLNDQLERVRADRSNLEKEASAWKQDETSRRVGHDKTVAMLDSIHSRILAERKAEQEEQEARTLRHLTEMKAQWSRHEKDVEQLIRAICRRYSLEYVEAVPFRGNPDNTVRICDEYVIFDAKSPGGDDLRNFPQYIKAQTESVRKYATQEGVRKEIFLVIPQDTTGVISQYAFNMADYTVYAITPNSLEPILLALKKLEEYEFVNELSPEDRENICRLIGKFTHVLKRRIQVDQFFTKEFFDVLSRCETGLPREMLEKVVEFEISEKLNPPQERRSKQILTSELQEETKRIEREASARAATTPLSSTEPLLPLFEKEVR